MNEQELRDGLHDAMVAGSPPPPMNPNTALDAARRAHRRRRASWAGAAAAAAVVALAVGAVVALAPPEHNGLLQIDMAGAQTSSKTEPPWPNGQTDRTARSGPQAKKGDQLLQALSAALPDTLSVDANLKYPDSNDTVTAAQAQFAGKAGDKEIWEYMVTTAVTSKSAPKAGTGRVIAEVHTPGNTEPADLCQLARNFWGIGGDCQERTVQGRKVGVVTKSQDERIQQAAGYRYDDGTVVFVAQSQFPDNEGPLSHIAKGSMAQLPLTVDQLAALVFTPSFKIS
jgi:hypothetical protein